VLDTGVTNHMTGAHSVFAHLDTNVGGTVRFGDGSVVEIEGRGSIIFVLKNDEHRTLAGVYYIPRLVANIVSLGQMEEAGYRIDLYDGALRIYDEARELLTKVSHGNTRQYILELVIGRPVCLVARSSEAAWWWHERFSHISFKSLRSLATKQMVRGLPHLHHIDQVYDSCLIGKQRRTPFPSQAKRRAEHALDLVHGDLCGPVSPPTPSGNKYFLLLIDEMSRYMWLHLLSSKDQVVAAIRNFQSAVEVESGRKLKVLRTDRGGEFTSVEFSEHCARRGVQRQLTAPYTPQQNGVVERRNQTIVGMARSILKAKALPNFFWGEAVHIAVHLLNRAPTRALDGKTRSRPGMESVRRSTTYALLGASRTSRRRSRGYRSWMIVARPRSSSATRADPRRTDAIIPRPSVW
jgi:transposase InsO family protein